MMNDKVMKSKAVNNKRVAYFTGEAKYTGIFTPHKLYAVIIEDDTSFTIKDNEGDSRFCLKHGCAHICHGDWLFADIVEDIKEEEEQPATEVKPKKTKKWSKWIENTTGKCPKDLKRKQKIKLKWSDGDKFTIYKPRDAAWYIDNGESAVNITHYKVKLKDISVDTLDSPPKQNTDWQENVLGVRPVPKDTQVEVELKCGEILKGDYFNWGKPPMEGREIVKWRLVV
jgi:hypothetical protein